MDSPADDIVSAVTTSDGTPSLDELDVTCWYVSVRRVYEKLGAPQANLAVLESMREHAPWEFPVRAKRAALELIRSADARPLTELIMNGLATPGTFFVHYGPMQFAWSRTSVRTDPSATATAKLNWLTPRMTLRFAFSASDLTSTSARGQLRGTRRQLMFGVIQEATDTEIQAIPYMVGTPIKECGVLGGIPTGDRHNEIFVDDIGSFERIRDVRPPSLDRLEKLKDIPERDIKRAFQEIIGEAFTESDWGGEHHDLQTNRLIRGGRRVAAVFAFKGPAIFRQLHPGDMGKNGDQIDRLFHESAQLYVVQHCHTFAASVRNMMQTYSATIPARHFMMIDGVDTFRILRAYGKCGFRQPPARRS